ncbi:PadR family transcriptional regulator [Knoellia sp. S7-12]|uniref:PadR family transcriptional regulator n=1 Tax=Knoellia sp. S7-12 TaxID=3126698 RepID=UPI0033681B3C
MTDAPWPSDWLRGALALLVLTLLAPGRTYGYAIATELETRGFGAIKGGTLYPLLGRLEAEGLIASQWEPGEGGPGRKYFELTESGTAHLAAEVARWSAFSDCVTAVLTGSPVPSARRS